ncbi:5-aminolevulinate synthase [Tricladium varicosporioides]|nr:5-aminolevulinate synthase [Hymenoscyphus varicosporioides]
MNFPVTNSAIAARIKGQKVVTNSARMISTFYRNLEEALDTRRVDHTLFSICQNTWQAGDAVDFSSNDVLSLGSTGILRDEFLRELSLQPQFTTGSGDFHNAETGLIMGSGYEANVAIWSTVPRPGDVIVYDTLVHASTYEGMKQSLATDQEEFQHNDVASFKRLLISILETKPLISQAKRSVIIAVESVYSMDGDICLLQELVDIAKELFPSGNAQFVVDEAHSTGVIGPKGSGLVSELGLEDEIAIRIHTYGKAMSASGAIILGKQTIKSIVVNFARSFIFSTAPSITFVAAIRSGFNLLKTGKTKTAQMRIQLLVALFLREITSRQNWEECRDMGLLSVALSNTWEEQPFLAHIVPIQTRQQYNYWLFFHLHASGFCVFPVEYPTVPRGQSRIKITFHAGNTTDHIKGLAAAIYEWVDEMIKIE